MTDARARPRTLVPPPLPYLAAVAGGVWLERRLHPLTLELGTPGVVLGTAFVAVGLTLLGWTLLSFRRPAPPCTPFFVLSMVKRAGNAACSATRTARCAAFAPASAKKTLTCCD